jgi:hypothetical protein
MPVDAAAVGTRQSSPRRRGGAAEVEREVRDLEEGGKPDRRRRVMPVEATIVGDAAAEREARSERGGASAIFFFFELNRRALLNTRISDTTIHNSLYNVRDRSAHTLA